MKFYNLNEIYKIVPKEDLIFFQTYLHYIKLVLQRGFRVKKTSIKNFRLMYKAISKQWPEDKLLGYLQREFIKRNLSLSLLIEPLDGAEWLFKNKFTLTLDKASPILMQIIAPISRIIAILNKQRPPFYQPFSNIIFIYFVLYIMYDKSIRLILKNYGMKIQPKSILNTLLLLNKESKQVLTIIYGFKFKLKIAGLISLAQILIYKNINKEELKLNIFEKIKYILYVLWYMVDIRDKTKGLDKI